jgi:myxalamid-type polyketide synthase MxaE and MxaD
MDSSGGDVPDSVLFGVHVALCALWRAWGIPFEAVVGHGAGRVAAAHVLGTLSLEDAVRLLGQPTQTVAADSLPDWSEAADEQSGSIAAADGLPGLLEDGADVPSSIEPGDDLSGSSEAAGDLSGSIAAGDDLAGASDAGLDLPSLIEASSDLPGPIAAGSDLPGLIEAGFDVFLEVGPPSAAAATLIRGARVAALEPGRPARAGLLAALGRLFSLGVDVDWSAL